MSPLERMAEAYWNAFRDGFIRVGGKPEDYPVWTSGPVEVKSETLRCLRHAVEVLRDTMSHEEFDYMFPDAPVQRNPSRTMTVQDKLMSEKVR